MYLNDWLWNPIHTKIFEGGTLTVIVLVSKSKQTFRYKIELQKGSERLEQVLEGNICMDKISPSYILLEEDPPKLSESVAEIIFHFSFI